MCQKLQKLAGSKQSYCKNYQAYFLAHPVVDLIAPWPGVNMVWRAWRWQ